jgi:hypothetical protein
MALGAVPMRQARDTRRAAVGGAALLGFLLVAACSEGNGAAPCLAEDVERCRCSDGRSGFQVCPEDGGGDYTACDCDEGASPYLPEAGEPEASDDAASDHDDSGGLMFMSPCSTAAGSPACPPGTSCDDFPAKGQFCSKPCKVATDCPPPSPGCNMMGVCKAP